MSTDAIKAERERVETEEVLLDLAEYVGDPKGIGGLAILECQWCHAAFTLDSGLNLKSHKVDCGFRRVAEAALKSCDAGQRTETLYASAYDLGPFNMSADYFTILFRKKPTEERGNPVQVSWKEPEDSDEHRPTHGGSTRSETCRQAD